MSSFIKSKRFFDIANFPLAKFEIDTVTPIHINQSELLRSNKDISAFPTDSIFGTLTIKGISKPINFPARIDMRYYSLQSSATFMINRFPWNLSSQSPNNRTENVGDVPDTIEVGFDIIANAR